MYNKIKLIFSLFIAVTLSNGIAFSQQLIIEGHGASQRPEWELKTVLPASSSSGSVMADEIKCVLFDNMDPFHFGAYYQYIQSSEYSDIFSRASFSDEFFKNNKITDFELAIFNLGSYPLNAQTAGGIKLIDKIIEMYNAGKRVMITGNITMLAAFRIAQGNDPTVRNFFDNILGLEYYGYRPVCDSTYSGNQLTVSFNQFVARGAIADPVSLSSIKHCNVTFNGQTPLNPYCFNVDVFKLKSVSNAKEVDHFVLTDTDSRSDTLLGIRAENTSGGKIVFWSMGFEYMANDYSRQFVTIGAIRWLLKSGPAPGAKLEFLPNEINFGAMDIGEKAEAEFIVRNDGISTLTISKIEFSFGDPAFQIKGGIPKTPINIPSDNTLNFTVIFQPTDNYNYVDYIDFTSNDMENEIKGVGLKGRGGTGIGALLALNYKTINFGSVGVLKQKFADLEMTNAGNRELTINWISIENDEKNAYSFVFGSAVPVILQPGNSKTVRIKFVPQVVGEEYNSVIKILSTSIDASETYIPMTGVGITPGKGPQIELSSNDYDFGYIDPTNPGEGKSETFIISNTGEMYLDINELNWENNTDNAFSISNEYTLPHRVAPEESFELTINFLPIQGIHYNAKLEIVSNAENEPTAELNLLGSGTTSSAAEYDYSGSTFDIRLINNPVSDWIEIEFISRSSSIGYLSLSIYDLSGRLLSVLSENEEAGNHREFIFDARKLSPGNYFIRATFGSETITMPLLIVR